MKLLLQEWVVRNLQGSSWNPNLDGNHHGIPQYQLENEKKRKREHKFHSKVYICHNLR
jgi:hypothetical protein